MQGPLFGSDFEYGGRSRAGASEKERICSNMTFQVQWQETTLRLNFGTGVAAPRKATDPLVVGLSVLCK